jgi:TPR repeat protein
VARLAALTQRDFNALSSQAESGDREAQFWLGSIYEQGRLVPKDRELAEGWLLKSAEEGYAPSERALGLLYWRSDPAKAAMWLQQAAQKGDAEAQFDLGNAYQQGLLGTINYTEALNWIQESAKQEIQMHKSVSVRCTKTERASDRTTPWPQSGTERLRNTFPI